MGTITTTDGTEIYYKDWGEGQPIVFSHGWPLSADDWDTQMLFFLQHGYRVIAHDRRGHGRSSQPGDGHDMDHYADDLAALTAHLDLRDAIQVFRFTLQFRRPPQQGRVERLQRAEPGPLKRGCTGRTVRWDEWQALAECVARGGENAPDTPKSKRALRFSSLADPMPRSLPALPGRQAVPP